MNAAPHNLQAEMAVIGAVLMDNGQLARVQDMLAPEDFYGPANQAIWDVVVRLVGEGRVADGVTLKEHFSKTETLKQIGGARYLTDLLDSAAFGPEIVDYARLLKELSGRRRIAAAAHHILRELEAHDGVDGKPAADLAVEAVTEIEKAVAQGDQRRFRKLPVAAIEAVTAAMSKRGGGVSTGLKNLDRRIGGLFPGDLIILAARPSMGKTALALEIASHVASQAVPEGETGGAQPPDGAESDARRRVVAFFSLEMDTDQLGQRALSAALLRHENVRLAYSAMRNGWVKREHRDAIAAAATRMPFVEIDDRAGINLAYLRERMGALVKTHGRLDLVVVDYLQLMTLNFRNKAETLAEALGRLTKGLKGLAKEFRIPIIALSQLSRQVEMREDKRPQLSDLRDSGTIEQDADVVLFVYREHYYLERQGEPKKNADKLEWQNQIDASESWFDIIAAKQRNGPLGDVRQYWDGASGLIADTREEVCKV